MGRWDDKRSLDYLFSPYLSFLWIFIIWEGRPSIFPHRKVIPNLGQNRTTRSGPFIGHVYVLDLFLKDMHSIRSLLLLFLGRIRGERVEGDLCLF